MLTVILIVLSVFWFRVNESTLSPFFWIVIRASFTVGSSVLSAFKSKAAWVAVEIGLSASDVLSTFQSQTVDFVTSILAVLLFSEFAENVSTDVQFNWISRVQSFTVGISEASAFWSNRLSTSSLS